MMNALDQVTIYLADSCVYDRDDECMKATIVSFEIVLDGQAGSGFYCASEPQVVLHLRNIKPSVKYLGVDIECNRDKDTDVVMSAVDSVLQYLHKKNCVGKDSVTFQSRRGGYLTQDLQVSNLICITFDQKPPSSFCLNFKEGIISRTYAYLDEGKLCLFLNDSSKNTLNKIDAALAELFPRKL